jgi:hypothetical protein
VLTKRIGVTGDVPEFKLFDDNGWSVHAFGKATQLAPKSRALDFHFCQRMVHW